MSIVNITPQVKFSLDICRGSSEERRQLAANINEQIFNTVSPNIKDGVLELSDFEQALHKSLPEDKRVDIIQFEPIYDNEEGASDLIEDDYDNYIGQTIEIPSENGKLSGASIVTIFHESRHVLDNLVNTKYLARVKSMYANDLYTSKYNRLINDFYNDLENPTSENKEKELKKLNKKLKNFLKNKPVEHQIDCLQDLRYTMETERNAFADQYKFESRLYEQGISTGYELEDESMYYFFDEKIDLIKQKTADIIAKERERHKAKLDKKA